MAASFPGSKTARRILIIRLRRIGDTVLITPCLTALKSWRPDVRIDVLLESESAPVLRHHPLVDQVIELPSKANKLAGAISRLGVIRDLRSRHYDLVINLHGGPTSLLMARLSGTRVTLALAKHAGSSLMTMRAPDPIMIWQKTKLHAVENQLALIKWLGVPIPSPLPRTSLAVEPSTQPEVARRFRESGIEGRYAVVHPSAAHPSKQWGLANFAEAISSVYREHSMPSVLIGSPHEKRTVQELLSLTTTPAIALHDMPLSQTMALISGSSLFLGNDSGPAHIAAALDIPLVVIYNSATSAWDWRPWTNSPHRAVKPGARDGRLCPDTPCSPCTYPTCIRQVSAEQVLSAISSVLAATPAEVNT